MPAVQFPSGFFLNKTNAQALALGKVYIGEVDLDPTVLANRVSVTAIQENGTPIVLAGSAQPFILNGAGMIVYNGSVVQMRVTGDYSLAVHSASDVPQYYFASAASSTDVTSSQIQLIAQGSDPTPQSGSGWIYTKNIEGITEFFYEDSEGNVLQFTSGGAFNISLGDSIVEALRLIAEEEIEGTQFRGEPITLVIDENGDVECDLTLGLNYYLLLDEEVDTFSFTNAPDLRVPNILVSIENAGSFQIQTFDFLASGGTVLVPDTWDGSLTPPPSATTDYGIALFPGPRLSIYPVLMKGYAP